MTRTIAASFLAVLLVGSDVIADTAVCRATRDVWLSAANERERGCNMGAARRIKLKVWQEFGLVDFDVSLLKGRAISRAAVYVKPAGGAKLKLNAGSDLKWLTVSTVSHDWVEGTQTRYNPGPKGGGATFNESSCGRRNWGWPGAKCWNVILGNGNTLRDDRPMSPEKGWLRAEIDPRLVRALVAGASHGLMLMDGSTGVHVNNYIASRETGNGPYLRIQTTGRDATPPAKPTDVAVTPAPDFAGRKLGAVMVSLTVPRDAFAYHVRINGSPLVRWQIPFAAGPSDSSSVPRPVLPGRAARDTRPGKTGRGTQSFIVRDLEPGAEVRVEIAAVDAAGNVSGYATAAGTASPALTVPRLPASEFRPKGGAPKPLGRATVWAFPEVTKVDPVTGAVRYEPDVGDFRRRNPVWDGATGTARLGAARGEIVSFQMALEGVVKGCTIAPSDLTGPGRIPGSRVRLWRNWYVGRDAEYALPLTGPFDCPAADNKVKGQTLQAVTVDVHVPSGARVGNYRGTVTASAGANSAKLALKVKVYDVVIPDEVHFNPELNCYKGPGRAGSDKFRDSFRLAHYHRATINRVPYSQNGRVHADWTPRIDVNGHVTDWSRFDADFGGLLDGSWFRGNPRSGVPVPTFYLPLFEGWPKDFRKHYRPGPGVPLNGRDKMAKLKHDILAKPIDEAFDRGFKEAFVNCTRDFVRHFDEKGWNRTVAQCYLNNKPKYGYTMWTLDEPFEQLDWEALNFFARLYKEGVGDEQVYTPAWHRAYFEKGLAGLARRRPTFLFRGDISRPMWQGSTSDGLMNIVYANNAQFTMPRLMADLKRRAPTILYSYGACNAVNRSNWESAAWCLRAYAHGCDGVLPWQSLGGAGSMKSPNTNGLIIDAGSYGHAIASLRVHALRRGAQDCELLRLLQLKRGWSRAHVGLLVSQKVPLSAHFSQAFADEAAALTFGNLSSRGFCELKEGVLKLLAEPD